MCCCVMFNLFYIYFFIEEMGHKYKALLRNLPTRHIIINVDQQRGIKDLLIRLRNLDVVNFFIIGNLTTIKNVLDMANINKYFNKKFAWHVITQVCNIFLFAILSFFFWNVEIFLIKYQLIKMLIYKKNYPIHLPWEKLYQNNNKINLKALLVEIIESYCSCLLIFYNNK